jgi:hypothetical protein
MQTCDNVAMRSIPTTENLSRMTDKVRKPLAQYIKNGCKHIGVRTVNKMGEVMYVAASFLRVEQLYSDQQERQKQTRKNGNLARA